MLSSLPADEVCIYALNATIQFSDNASAAVSSYCCSSWKPTQEEGNEVVRLEAYIGAHFPSLQQLPAMLMSHFSRTGQNIILLRSEVRISHYHHLQPLSQNAVAQPHTYTFCSWCLALTPGPRREIDVGRRGDVRLPLRAPPS